MTLVFLEKFPSLIYPRKFYRLERVYKAVVEQALLGKDPDLAEDLSGVVSFDKIARQRQRQEICTSMRYRCTFILILSFSNSNFFYNMYMIKNALEIVFTFIFMFLNSVWPSLKECPGRCEINLFGESVSEAFLKAQFN